MLFNRSRLSLATVAALGALFVVSTLFFPRGIIGLLERRKKPDPATTTPPGA